MTREELIRNLKYTMEKYKNDNVNTFDTNISVMCKDILDYLEQEPKTEQKKTCFDCKYHFMSDCYLECVKHNRINNNQICKDFEQLKEQSK